MPKTFRILKVFFFFLLIVLFAGTGCATSKKNTFYEKRKKQQKSSVVHASQLGRNKYYFSVGYQKKLTKSYKK